MSAFEVEQPILYSPFEEPAEHWQLEEGTAPRADARSAASRYFYRDPKAAETGAGAAGAGRWYELELVNLIRERLEGWRAQGYPGVTRTTLELLNYWRRDGREQRLSSRSSRRPRRSSS